MSKIFKKNQLNMASSNSTKKLYTISLLLLVLLTISTACSQVEATPEILSRSIAESNPGAKEIWRISSVFVSGEIFHPLPVVLTPNRIVVAADLYDGGKKLLSLIPSTGSLE